MLDTNRSMPFNLILFNKPFGVLSQFRDPEQPTLAQFIDNPGFYPAGRLDKDSEGLLLLTNNGKLQARIAEPKHKLGKSYWVQVEGSPSSECLDMLSQGVELKDGLTKPCEVELVNKPRIWPRQNPIPEFREANSNWLNITLYEGKNRQVRRMCATIGHPVLRLIRHQIGPWQLKSLQPGEFITINAQTPVS